MNVKEETVRELVPIGVESEQTNRIGGTTEQKWL
jgi:hypothetical protein